MNQETKLYEAQNNIQVNLIDTVYVYNQLLNMKADYDAKLSILASKVDQLEEELEFMKMNRRKFIDG